MSRRSSRRDGRSPEAIEARRLYNTAAWQRLRLAYLAEHPLCVMCLRMERVDPATVVDHIIPHRGDHDLFFDADNLQSLCKAHHDATKQREDIRGYSDAVGLDGWPLDDQHPANLPRRR